MLRKGADLGVDLRIEPVGLGDGGAEIVQDQPLGHAAEIPEGVLQAAEKGFGGLAADDLAVGFAGEAEDDAEDMRPAAATVGFLNGRALAEIDLGFFAGSALQAAEGQLLLGGQSADEAADAVVLAGEAVVADQVLEDALGGQALVEQVLDEGAERFTEAGLALAARLGGRCGTAARCRRLDPFGADGRLAYFDVVGAGGRLAYFALFGADGRPGLICLPEVTGNGIAVNTQGLGDAPHGPVLLMQRANRVDGGHFELICHVCPPPAGSLGKDKRQIRSPQSGLI